MRFIKEADRSTLVLRLSEHISEDNEIRLIDAFVDKVDLASHGFTFKTDKSDQPDLGGPSEYHPRALLKLFIYGYLNKTRSSRLLEEKCRVNIEVIWLMNYLQPSHNTINIFRKENPEALVTMFATFNFFWKNIGLFMDKTMAIDGSFIDAQNGIQNNFSKTKIERHKKYIDKKAKEYLALLDKFDKEEEQQEQESNLSKKDIESKLEVLAKRKKKHIDLEKKLEESGDSQVSTTDPDSRLMAKRKGAKMAYNIQIATEESNMLIATFDVTNQGDTKAFHKIAKAAKDFLQDGDNQKTINGLGDKGYSDAEEIHKCQQDNIITYIAHKEEPQPKKEGLFTKADFVYNRENDTYKCPGEQILKTTGKLFKNRNRLVKSYQVSNKTCQNCPLKKTCLTSKSIENNKARTIVRSAYENAKEDNKKRVEEKREIYHLRKAMVEHPFGTIKRQWGYSYTLLKGFKKVRAEFALIFSAYNIRRAVSILGVKQIINRINQLEKLVFCLFCQFYNISPTLSNISGNKYNKHHRSHSVYHRINMTSFIN